MGIENPEALHDSDLNEKTQDPELTELQDIEDLLGRETQDGKGDDVPTASFVSYATDDVETETN